MTNIEKAIKVLDTDQKILIKLSEQIKESKIKSSSFPHENGPFAH